MRKSKYGQIVKLTKDLEFVAVFPTVREAALSVDSWSSNIYDAVRNGNQSHNFYWWTKQDYDYYLEGKAEAEKPVERNVAANVWIKLKDGSCHCWPAGLVESILLPPSVTGTGLAERVEYR